MNSELPAVVGPPSPKGILGASILPNRQTVVAACGDAVPDFGHRFGPALCLYTNGNLPVLPGAVPELAERIIAPSPNLASLVVPCGSIHQQDCEAVVMSGCDRVGDALRQSMDLNGNPAVFRGVVSKLTDLIPSPRPDGVIRPDCETVISSGCDPHHVSEETDAILTGHSHRIIHGSKIRPKRAAPLDA